MYLFEFLILWIATWIDQLVLTWLPKDHAKFPRHLFQIFSLLKAVLHYLTGKSQIERLTSCHRLISHRDGLILPSALLILLIQVSIEYSKTLSIDIECDDLAKKIASRKRISSTKILTLAIKKIYLVSELKQRIEDLRVKTFSLNDKDDLKVLSGLWMALKGTEPPEIPSCRWIEIGFQGTNPSTDFRGMGFLGLFQLAELSSQTRRMANAIFQVASQESTNLWFPYAVTGINVTAFQYQLLKSHKLDKVLYGSVASVEIRYANIYADIFTRFCNGWVDANPRDIMDFPRVFTKVKESYLGAIND